jgi:hypothetical protein
MRGGRVAAESCGARTIAHSLSEGVDDLQRAPVEDEAVLG